MIDRYRSSDELVLPFIFIPHGAPEPPEVAAFKARHPGWFTIPATFVPRLSEALARGREEAQALEPHPRERHSNGTLPQSPVQAFERSYAPLNNPGSALSVTRVAADTSSVSGSRHAYVAADPEQWLGTPSVGTGECVPLVQQATEAPHTSQWRRGALVKGSINIRPGTAVATLDDDGHYGNHADGRSHAAIYLGQDARGIWVIDQWNERRPGEPARRIAPHARRISFDDSKKPADNGNRYYAIQ